MDIRYLQSVAPQILEGLKVTFEATVLGMGIAAFLGLLVAAVRLLRIPILAKVFDFYVIFIRNTPLLVQLYFFYYVLPQYGIRFNAFILGILGLGVQFSCYTAEVYRAGFEQVPRGQWEAARALHLNAIQTLVFIVLPQALRPILPALGNYLISMFKDSSFLATITVYELLGTIRQLASLSFEYTLLFTTMGIIYLGLSYSGSLLVRSLEIRTKRS